VKTVPYEILRCHTDDDRIPIEEWLNTLDSVTRNRIRARIDRVEDGNFGDVKPVGGGVFELRMDFGPGYRVYFGLKGTVVHLMRGGMKGTQSADIALAKEFWSKHD
jgi:putative addiction module killer protein